MREYYIQILVVSIYHLNLETGNPALASCIFRRLLQYKSAYNLILFTLKKAANTLEELHLFDLDINGVILTIQKGEKNV